MVRRDLIVRLVEIGANVGILVPRVQARMCSFTPGSSVRVILLNGAINVRPVSAPRVYDLESLDEYRDRVAKEESDSPERWGDE